MPSSPSWLRIAALLSLVTTVKCVESRDPTPWTSRDFMKPVNKYEFVNLQPLPTIQSDHSKSFRKNFEEHKRIQAKTHSDKQYVDFDPQFQQRNKFRCPPCICSNTTSNLVSIFCFRCIFKSIPQNWSVGVDELIVKDCNRLKVLDLNTLLKYTSLTRVKIRTSSLIKVFSSSSLNNSSTILELDLAYNRISTLEDNSFLLWTRLLKLSLDFNNINNLTKQMFTGLNCLRFLSVQLNGITFIAIDTFEDMGNLVYLDISQNEIISIGHDLLPVGLFNPLRNLEEIDITDICSGAFPCGTYPNKALRVLANLRLLSIDGADRRGLGPEIKRLVHLKYLIINSAESYNFTKESYFDNVPFLRNLEFSGSIPHNINPKAFKKLTNLVHLKYSSFGFYNICQVLKDIQYLDISPLKYLTLRNLNDKERGCKELKAEQARYLTLFKLDELDLSYNELTYLSPEFITMLPATLQKIDLSGNCFSGKMSSRLHLFPKELNELNLNNQNKDCNECHAGEDITPHFEAGDNQNSMNTLTSPQTELINFFYGKRNTSDINTQEFIHYRLQRKLRILRGDNFMGFGRYLEFFVILSGYSLRELSLAGGEFKDWATRMNIMAEIEVADFSNNNAEDIKHNLFQFNSSLKYLSISNNLLGPAFELDTKSLFFEQTKKLVVLNISRNFITNLPYDYFRNLNKLQVLDISKNKLQMINISFSNMNELGFLDFSTNSIISISKKSRDDLDLIAADHRVYLDLTSNPLPCTCEGLEMMKWMAFTNVYLLSMDFLVCRNEFHEVREIGNIVQRVETLQRQCASKTVIILICVFSIIVFGILLLTSLMYRYRWKLRYLRSIALVKLLGSRAGATNKIGYRFDAYILYTDNTRRFVLRDCVRELEEKRGHRLCIEERDFLPGTYNVSNIVSGVQNSAKTVAIVTPEFYQGEYSEYSVKMALMEEIFTRRSVLFLCVCEPTDDKDLSHDLLTAMKRNNYIEYPPRDDVTDDIIDEFWNQFSQAIGKNDHEDIEVVVFENIQ